MTTRTTSARLAASASRNSGLFSVRELQRNGLISPNTRPVNLIRRFIEKYALAPISATAAALEMRDTRLYEEIEEKKTYALDTTLGRGRTCPVGQRMRVLNGIAIGLDLPPVYPGLKTLEDSIA